MTCVPVYQLVKVIDSWPDTPNAPQMGEYILLWSGGVQEVYATFNEATAAFDAAVLKEEQEG